MLDLNDIYLVCQLDYQSSTYRVCVNEMPFCHAEMCLSSIYLDLTPADVLWLYGMSPITEYRGGAGASALWAWMVVFSKSVVLTLRR